MIKQWAINYLRKKGFVVFHLEERARKCNDMCWLQLYVSEIKRDEKASSRAVGADEGTDA